MNLLLLKQQNVTNAFPHVNLFQQERCQTSDVMSITPQGPRLPFLNAQTSTPLPHKELPASRRDAATLTETRDTGRSALSLGPPRRRRWQIHKPREFHSSEEEELCTDEEQDFDLSHRRRWDKEPRYREEKRTQKHRVDRYRVLKTYCLISCSREKLWVLILIYFLLSFFILSVLWQRFSGPKWDGGSCTF